MPPVGDPSPRTGFDPSTQNPGAARTQECPEGRTRPFLRVFRPFAGGFPPVPRRRREEKMPLHRTARIAQDPRMAPTGETARRAVTARPGGAAGARGCAAPHAAPRTAAPRAAAPPPPAAHTPAPPPARPRGAA